MSIAMKKTLDLVDEIILWYDEIEAEASYAAQVDQDDRSWKHVMRTKLANLIWKYFGDES